MAFKMKGFTGFDFKSQKPKNKRGWSTDKHGERDFSEHNIAARKTEGTIEQQEARRKKNTKVDPDAPGTPGTPGHEPQVKRSDLDEKGKKLWDSKRAKKSPAKQKPELPVSESDNTNVDKTSANITIDAVDRKNKSDKKERSRQWHPSSEGQMYSNDQNKEFLNTFFKK